MDPVRRILRTFYALTGLFHLSTALIMGVNTLFVLDAGLTIFEAFAANAAFTAGQVVFEIPTGVVADTRGRRLSLLLGAVTLLLGTGSYIVLAEAGASFPWWAAASVVLGIGFSFYSGATEAWFVDALAAAGGPVDLDPYFARSNQLFAGALLVGTITGGLLGDVNLTWPYIARAAILLVLFAVAWTLMRDEGFETRPFRLRSVPTEVADIARASWEHGWKQRPVRLLMLISFLQFGFLIWGWYAWQPHFLELLGRDDVWVAGVIAALVGLLMMAGNQGVRLLHGRVSRPTLLVISSAGLAASMVGVGLVDTFYPAVGLFLLGMVFFGLAMPAKQAALHALIPSKQRATIISFDGLLGSAGGIGSQLALARIAQDRGYAAGYLVGGAALALAVPLAVLFRREVPRVEPPNPPTAGASTPPSIAPAQPPAPPGSPGDDGETPPSSSRPSEQN